MKRQKLQELKRTVHKMDFHPTKELVHALVDSNLKLLDELEGGPDTQAMQAELVERTRQLKLALTDVSNLAHQAYHQAGRDGNPFVMRAVAKARLATDLALEMASSKTTAWRREWSWYLPRLEEEFGDDEETSGVLGWWRGQVDKHGE